MLGVTGSIAAYKAAFLIRLLVKEGAEVRVIMTPAATEFVSPLTLSTLSKNKVFHSLADDEQWHNHAMLGRWADVILIAPASANTLAKMAVGLCDNLLLAVFLSATCPVLVAPAMDEDMWKHASTKRNLQNLSDTGIIFLPVESGELASGLSGEGRMAEPEAIVNFLADHLSIGDALKGKKVLITAGPTYEPIDPVRFIGNWSSGKMGIALADAMAIHGADVYLVLGPTLLSPGHNTIKLQRVKTSKEMYDACEKVFPEMDIAVMAAAVADYKPLNAADKKIKKQEGHLQLELGNTMDILKSLGEKKKDNQWLAGFALETDQEETNALRKLKEKNLDLIILNSLKDAGAGFMHDTNKVTLYSKTGERISFPLRTKKLLALDIVQYIIKAVEQKSKEA